MPGVIEKDATRQNNKNAISNSARTTPSTYVRLFVLLGARTIRGMSGYVLRLGSLVSARRSLHQSKPSIEAPKANTAPGGCNPENRPIGAVQGASRPPHSRGTTPLRVCPCGMTTATVADLDHQLRSAALVEYPQGRYPSLRRAGDPTPR
jgi:hypothetical protein